MWIKVDASIRDHRKVWKAADMTGEQIPTIIGCMVSLWLWCATNAPDGNLDDIPAATVARAAQWSGNAEDFEKTLILCGFLDVDGETGTRSIHNWMNEDRAGGALEKISDQREKANERKRRQRAAQRAAKAAAAETEGTAVDDADDSRAEMSRGSHADVTRDVTAMSRDREEKIRLDKSRKDIYVRGEAALHDSRADDASDASVTQAAQVNDASCANVTRDASIDANDASCADDASDRAPKSRRKRKADEPDAAFDAFWSLYPKKVGKREAVRAWNKIKHSEDVDAQIMEGVKRYADSVQSTEPAYIKNAQGWLNNERWKDEVTQAARKTVTRTNGPHDNVYDFDQIEAAAEAEGRSAAIETRRDVDYTEGFGDYKSTELYQFLMTGGDDTETDQQLSGRTAAEQRQNSGAV